MGTRARIGIQLQHNTVLSAYHHWDGYPEWLGVTLKEQYNSREKAADLINGGNMSTCWADEVWGNKLSKVNLPQNIILVAVRKLRTMRLVSMIQSLIISQKKITKNMHISGLLTMSGNVLR